MTIHRVEDLKVWQKAVDLTVEVYKATRKFPREEQYGLISQMQRAAASIPGCIAEGFIRFGARDRARFYNMGRASAEELRTYLVLSRRLGYAPPLAPAPFPARRGLRHVAPSLADGSHGRALIPGCWVLSADC